MRIQTPPQEACISRRNLKSVLAYISANGTGNISLPVLAKTAGVTPHHFSSLFTKTTGLSPHQYVLRERIEHAKRYLQDETLNVGQVSRLTGFRTQGHFAKVFRKLVGVTPSRFREGRLEANLRSPSEETK